MTAWQVKYSPVSDGQQYDPDKQPHCTLYGGTSVAQAKAAKQQKTLALAIRTRFYSAKVIAQYLRTYQVLSSFTCFVKQ